MTCRRSRGIEKFAQTDRKSRKQSIGEAEFCLSKPKTRMTFVGVRKGGGENPLGKVKSEWQVRKCSMSFAVKGSRVMG